MDKKIHFQQLATSGLPLCVRKTYKNYKLLDRHCGLRNKYSDIQASEELLRANGSHLQQLVSRDLRAYTAAKAKINEILTF